MATSLEDLIDLQLLKYYDTKIKKWVSINGGSSGGQDSKDNLETYSTEETRIGTWIDGKPLYRRVYELISPTTSGTTKMLELESNILPQRVMSFQSTVHGVGGSGFPLFNGTNYARVDVSPETHSIEWSSNSTIWGGRFITIIAEYTKTTD